MSCAAGCFHCGEPLPAQPLLAQIDGQRAPVCCAGCAAAAELIDAAGLQAFYRWREAPPPRPLSAGDDDWAAFDREQVRRQHVAVAADGLAQTSLLIDGLRCAACSWLIERAVAELPGVVEARMDAAAHRLWLRWRLDTLPYSALLRRIAMLGYRPVPSGRAEPALDGARRERNAALKRLAVAGLGMMQVMTYAVALYAGALQGIDAPLEHLLRFVSLLVATPVVLYSGWPFFASAARELAHRRLNMDVPVALAIGSAWLASVWNTVRGAGEVYFDSATMFVFFLSASRYIEMTARHRATGRDEALARSLPATALRRIGGRHERVGAIELEPGDVVVLGAGDVAPADGHIVSGRGDVDESALTGESRPIARRPGDRIAAGCVNLASTLAIEIDRVGADCELARVNRMLARARSERPPLARLADRLAAHFVAVLLVVAAALAAYFWQTAPERAFETVLAVLVVSCPCALSLATPTALTAATGAMHRLGLLVTRGRAIEALARVDHVLFDKTGTLTRGRPALVDVVVRADHDRDRAIAVAAALERASSHPYAHAFDGELCAETLTAHPGDGLEGRVDGRCYRIGTAAFVAALAGCAPEATPGRADDGSWLVLGDASGAIAWFKLADSPRPDAAETVAALAALGIGVEIASGDDAGVVAALARRLGVEVHAARRRPEDKLERIRELQRTGHTVAAVGDGINDGPVLAGADVSVALGTGTAIAQASADLILTGERLAPLAAAIELAKRAQRAIRQNFGWALAYNALALPVAASGALTPWQAALGMSLSSVIVVANAARLGRAGTVAPIIEANRPATAGNVP